MGIKCSHEVVARAFVGWSEEEGISAKWRSHAGAPRGRRKKKEAD